MENEVFAIIAAGLVGTTGLTLFLYLIHTLKLANGDMVRAIGSLLTRSETNALPVGLVIQYSFGIIFAIIYYLFVAALPADSRIATILLCMLLGFVHGMVVGLGLTYAVAIHHPLKRFQVAGVGVAVAHWLAHVIYGLLVGLVLSTLV